MATHCEICGALEWWDCVRSANSCAAYILRQEWAKFVTEGPD